MDARRSRIARCDFGVRGEHARASDRWTGAHDIVPLDLTLSFDVDRGFDFTETDSATFITRCLRF